MFRLPSAIAAGLCVAAVAATPAFADVIAYTTPAGTAANQHYGQGFGMDFSNRGKTPGRPVFQAG